MKIFPADHSPGLSVSPLWGVPEVLVLLSDLAISVITSTLGGSNRYTLATRAWGLGPLEGPPGAGKDKTAAKAAQSCNHTQTKARPEGAPTVSSGVLTTLKEIQLKSAQMKRSYPSGKEE